MEFENLELAAQSRARKIAIARGRLRKLPDIVGGQSDGTREVGPGAVRRCIGRLFLCNNDGREEPKKEQTEESQGRDRDKRAFIENMTHLPAWNSDELMSRLR
jgi:hypothetical protein